MMGIGVDVNGVGPAEGQPDRHCHDQIDEPDDATTTTAAA